MKSIWTKKHVDTQTGQHTVHANQKFILVVTEIICEGKRNRLLPKHREMLTFLNRNLLLKTEVNE